MSLLLIVTIPVLLNFILLLNSPSDDVIGGDEGPTVWLAFWGTYIGAIGAIVMAGVSYYQSRSESERLSLRTQIEYERNLYNKLEHLIEKDVSIHSLSRIYEIKSAYNTNKDDCMTLMNKLREDIHLASLYCVTFDSIITSDEYKEFGNKLSKLNLNVFDIIDDVTECDLKSIDIMLEKMKPIQTDVYELINLGFSVLKKQNEVIISLEKKLKKHKSPLYYFMN